MLWLSADIMINQTQRISVSLLCSNRGLKSAVSTFMPKVKVPFRSRRISNSLSAIYVLRQRQCYGGVTHQHHRLMSENIVHVGSTMLTQRSKLETGFRTLARTYCVGTRSKLSRQLLGSADLEIDGPAAGAKRRSLD